jgi:hypothetical protein
VARLNEPQLHYAADAGDSWRHWPPADMHAAIDFIIIAQLQRMLANQIVGNKKQWEKLMIHKIKRLATNEVPSRLLTLHVPNSSNNFFWEQ